MIGDQDRCEWVNVPSCTGSPGYSQTKGHKMVIVVVVWTDFSYWSYCHVEFLLHLKICQRFCTFV